MVHRKSTYRLTYKNYKPDVRKMVYEENHALRLKRQNEERSHVSIEEEEESDCDCDSEEENDLYESRGHTFSTISQSNTRPNINKENTNGVRLRHKEPVAVEKRVASTPIPRLHFSPEHTPRALHENGVQDEQPQMTQENNMTRDDFNVTQGLHDDPRNTSTATNLQLSKEGTNIRSNYATHHTRTKERAHNRSDAYNQTTKLQSKVTSQDTMTTKERLGVMRPRANIREYDLIPATKEEPEVCHHHSCTIHKPKHASDKNVRQTMSKSHRYPYTTHLTKTTKKNFMEHEKKPTPFVASGSACESLDKSIAKKGSYNIYLNKDQVRPSALKASELRNREIEKIINKQRKLRIEDWRQENVIPTVINHSSVFADANKQIFSRRLRPRHEAVTTLPERMHSSNNCCRHCGGIK